jgi:hypothetical protein
MKQAEREKLKQDRPELVLQIKPLWKGGKICGQCTGVKWLAKGANGVCHRVKRNDYTKPEDHACSKFEAIE